MDYMQELQRFEIIIEWLDDRTKALESEMSDTPLGDRYTELYWQLKAVNAWYDELFAERETRMHVERIKADNALESWKAAQHG